MKVLQFLGLDEPFFNRENNNLCLRYSFNFDFLGIKNKKKNPSSWHILLPSHFQEVLHGTHGTFSLRNITVLF